MSLFNGKIKIYCAVKMTGRYKDEVLKESLQLNKVLERAGFEVLSPVLEENIENVHDIIHANRLTLSKFWDRDKEMLKEAHILLDYNACGTSDGVNIELGKMRFSYWKPVIRIYPQQGAMISRIEYDTVCNDLYSAVYIIQKRWGTKSKLFWWRVGMLLEFIPKFVNHQIRFLWDCL